MATLTPQNVLAAFAATLNTAGAMDFTFAATSGSAGDEWTCNGRDLLLVNNSGSAAGTVTVSSNVDEKNRETDITTYSLAAADYAAIPVGLTNSKGWKTSAGKVQITTSGTDVKAAVLRLPAGYP